ncbi:DUF2573 family protein [Paenibacillus larvae]|uniref:DUF2573 domain-containing protein n=3 Tax=Paenibacillus larvae TaxID=1464 RepID=V9WAH7_9BACL|nr:DUF2573 family protein [Paenibacillus larvae]AHD06715.1 hypothetical protein ERIC2_c29340 [Paenibacillus larvae subsp. larvae DSM 25430]AQR77773.1 hypothetical protein BXP28_10905 [Paenibacillus larvae subsp. larvae]AQT84205.1 hypothetical protein B1222_07050 [Paenibacillus larvae subsp. pulvifaciens]AQZ46179.1 hypothetical protein B5S25_05640 [Paenibacillus larvae subsp. pulvifaciens]AVF21129.1 hypothetical protein ERICI_01229 [Paenibacillus larvae subsp. larvae]
MHAHFQSEFDALMKKAAELLTGDSSEEMVNKIKIWSMYQHIHKIMPALTSHWNQTHPDSKSEMRKLFEEIRDLNQQFKAQSETDKQQE